MAIFQFQYELRPDLWSKVTAWVILLTSRVTLWSWEQLPDELFPQKVGNFYRRYLVMTIYAAYLNCSEQFVFCLDLAHLYLQCERLRKLDFCFNLLLQCGLCKLSNVDYILFIFAVSITQLTSSYLSAYYFLHCLSLSNPIVHFQINARRVKSLV